MYSTIDNIKRSLELAWKHKILWVFGLMLLGFSFNPSSSGNSSKQNNYKNQTPNINIESRSETSNLLAANLLPSVLGSSVSSPSLLNFIPNIGAVTLSFFIFLVFAIILGLIIKSWTLGAFLYGTKKASYEELVSLRDLANKGRAKIRVLIRYSIYTTFLFLLVTIVMGVAGVLLLVSKTLILLSILIFLFYILFVISFILADEYISRYIVLEDKSAWEGIKLGFKLLFSNIGKSLKLVFTSCALQLLMGILALTIAGALGAGIIKLTSLTFLFIPLALPLGIAIILGFMAFGGYIVTYSNLTWTILFIHLLEKGNTENVTQ